MSQPDRGKLPIRQHRFGGVANRTLDGSERDWEAIGHVDAPDGAPNVLVVLIDDAGFGNSGTFGGPIDTPHYTRMAEGGVRYNRFHVTALCSPTRAAMLTGRNNHAVGFGSVGEFSTAFPGYTVVRPGRLRSVSQDPAGQRVQRSRAGAVGASEQPGAFDPLVEQVKDALPRNSSALILVAENATAEELVSAVGAPRSGGSPAGDDG